MLQTLCEKFKKFLLELCARMNTQTRRERETDGWKTQINSVSRESSHPSGASAVTLD